MQAETRVQYTGAAGEESGMARHAAAADPMFP